MSEISLAFDPPVLNAAGILGFAPDRRSMADLPPLGGFFTSPVSLTKRTPAHGMRFLPFPGGFLLHSGYPNPGLSAVLRHHAEQWRRQDLPIWVHLLASSPDDLRQMVLRLEGIEGVVGVEVGIPPEADAAVACAFIRAAQGELPVMARLPLERAVELEGAVSAAGAAAVSLAPPRGALPLEGGGLLRGRLYGPALFPLALEAVRILSGRGLPVVGAGGVYTQENIAAMQAAGAIAVQLDAVLWRGF
jgi:dihydroorotate dehydrogenase (NAD+) catalytic subunit